MNYDWKFYHQVFDGTYIFKEPHIASMSLTKGGDEISVDLSEYEGYASLKLMDYGGFDRAEMQVTLFYDEFPGKFISIFDFTEGIEPRGLFRPWQEELPFDWGEEDPHTMIRKLLREKEPDEWLTRMKYITAVLNPASHTGSGTT